MQQGPPRRRRARPVADAPIDSLLLRAEDLTKGWLLALLEQAPLYEAPGILAADLARDGPRLCDAIVRALADERDLRRIEPGGALEGLVARIGELAGAQGVEATSRAVDALHAVIWSALRDELPRPDPDQISELAERLGLVIELARGAALRRCEGPAVPKASGPGVTEATGASAVAERPESFGRPHVVEPPVAEPRPARDALWVGALEDEIVRAERSGSPLSLLLAELQDAERVLTVEPASEASSTFGRFAQAVRGAVRRQDILASETETRVWIIARDTGRAGGLALGSRIASAVRAAEPWRGAPMVVSVGLAVLGEDGRDAAGLINAAEEAKYFAAANGVEVAQPERSQEPCEPPRGGGPRLVG
jgi:GGDEF domain-containing protein